VWLVGFVRGTSGVGATLPDCREDVKVSFGDWSMRHRIKDMLAACRWLDWGGISGR
jgi:hypothetical protein